MTNAKPFLALSSTGLAVALVLVAIHIQRDPLAFTGDEARNSGASADVTFTAPIPASITVRPVVITGEIPSVRGVVSQAIAAPKPQLPTAASTLEAPPIPCRPSWRELESGPVGRMVRDIC